MCIMFAIHQPEKITTLTSMVIYFSVEMEDLFPVSFSLVWKKNVEMISKEGTVRISMLEILQHFCENTANGSFYVCPFLFYKFYKGHSRSFIDLDTLSIVINQTISPKLIKSAKDTSNDQWIYHSSNLKCSQSDQLPCKPHSSNCFSFSSICVYRLDRYGTLIPCKTGSHLQECRYFVCNLHFKCFGYYCIPWGHTCDGKWDCPFGYDEKNCSQRHCYGMFKCVRFQICLHIGDICDGYYDCPWNDDELMCKLIGTKCPVKCRCLNFGIVCTNVSFDVRTLFILPHISVHVTNCNIKSILYLNPDIIALNLSTNFVTNICTKKAMLNLTVFDLSYNQIMFITKGCFDSLEKLMILRLQNNRMQRIEDKSFHNLTNLLTVDLSNNKLSTLSKNVFANTTQLHLLILHNNPFSHIFVTMFNHLASKLLITDDYKICCLASGKTGNCISKEYLHEVCHKYIFDSVIIVATVHAIIIILLNVISVILNSRQTEGPVKMIVNAHCIVKMLYSSYLIIILAMDTYYDDTLLIHESQWRNSIFCVMAFAIVLIFYFISIFLALFLSFGRLMVVLHPLDSKFRVKNFVFRRVLFGEFTLGIFSVSAGLKLKLINWPMPSILCSPFIDPSGSSLVIRLTTVGLLFMSSLAILFMISIYSYLIQNITRPHENMQISSQRDTFPVVIQVFSLIISNVISLIISTVIYLVCLFFNFYPKDTLTWTTVTIVPIKCIMDPIIFIIVTPRRNRNMKNKLGERSFKSKRLQ